MKFKIKRIDTTKEAIQVGVAFTACMMNFLGKEMSDEETIMFLKEIDDYSAIEVREGLRILSLKYDRFTSELLAQSIEEFKQPKVRFKRFIERVLLGIGPEEMKVVC